MTIEGSGPLNRISGVLASDLSDSGQDISGQIGEFVAYFNNYISSLSGQQKTDAFCACDKFIGDALPNLPNGQLGTDIFQVNPDDTITLQNKDAGYINSIRDTSQRATLLTQDLQFLQKFLASQSN